LLKTLLNFQLIAAAGSAECLGGGKRSRRRTLQPDALCDVFGVDLEDAESAEIAKPSPKPKSSKKVKSTKPPKTKKKPKKPVAKGKRVTGCLIDLFNPATSRRILLTVFWESGNLGFYGYDLGRP